MATTLILTAGLALSTSWSIDALAASQLIGVDWHDANIYDIDKNTAKASNPRLLTDGTANPPWSWFIAVSPNDASLFGLSMGNYDPANGMYFCKLNMATGFATVISNPDHWIDIEGDMGFDPTTGVLYALNGGFGGSQLYTFDTSNGAATYIGSIPNVGDTSAMAFDANGVLWAVDTSLMKLYKVDKSNASLISEVSTSLPSFGVAGLAFDPDTGVLYYACEKLLTIDTNTGATNVIGKIDYALHPSICSLTFTLPDPCVPATSLTINSGWNQKLGASIALGDVDNEWMAVADPDPTTTEPRPAFVITPDAAWSPAQPNSQWVSSFPTAEHDQNGHYVFAYRFCLQSNINAFLNLSVRADDAATVYLNGVNLGTTGEHSFDHPPLVVATTSADFGKFKTGENKLTVDVENIYNVSMGFNLTGTITGQLPQYHYCCSDSASGVLGTVWNDPNRNKIQDLGETGRPNSTVRLYQGSTIVATTHTDGLGNYYFMDLPPGDYRVLALLDVNKSFTTASSYIASLGRGQIVPNRNFGIANVDWSKIAWDKKIFDFPIEIKPNPFNPEATISFVLPRPMHVSMKIYNVEGQLVKTLVDADLVAGDHKWTWDGRNEFGQTTASGVYFLRTATPQGVTTKKLMLLK